MFTELTTPEQQRVAQAYMPQMGGRSPADVGTMMQQLLSNPDLAAQAMSMYQNASGGNNNSGGTGAGSRIEDLMSNMMAQDGTTAPLPPARPTNVKVASANPNNVMPPSKPVELTGDDRVAKAGGPGSPRGNALSTGNPTELAEGAVDPSMSSIILNTLAALGIGGGAAYGLSKLRGGKQMPPNVPDGGEDIPATSKTNLPAPVAQPKVLPVEAGGAVVPVSPLQQRFQQAFLNDIPDAEYTEIKQPAQIDNRKKLSGPPDNDDRDKVKKADGKTINAEDETEDAGVRRTVNKATTAKEKIKPKVRVK